MQFPGEIVVPALCTVFYATGAIWFKRGLAHGVGIWRTTFISNVLLGITMAPIALSQVPGTDWKGIIYPATCGVAFLGGQLLTMLALSRGDVSMTTPLMGLKTVFVAICASLLLTDAVPVQAWVAAVLSAIAVALIGSGPRGTDGGDRGVAVAATMGSVLVYGLHDVLVQKWAPAFGAIRFSSFTFVMLSLGSVVFIPFFHGRLRDVSPAGWKAVLPGSIAMSLNHVGICLTLAVFGAAMVVNVVYSARGLVSIALVWWVGHWFGNEERLRGAHLFPRRLFGAILLLAAIALVVAPA